MQSISVAMMTSKKICITTKSFQPLPVKLYVMPRRHGMGGVRPGGWRKPTWLTKANLDSVLTGIGAATGISSWWNSRGQQARVAEMERRVRREENKEAPIDESFPVERSAPDHSEPPSPSDKGSFFGSPSEIHLRDSSADSILDILQNVDPRYLLFFSGLFILIPMVVNFLQLRLANRLLNEPDAKAYLLTLKSYATAYLQRSTISIFLGLASGLTASYVNDLLLEDGYELDSLELLAMIVFIFIFLRVTVFAIEKLRERISR